MNTPHLIIQLYCRARRGLARRINPLFGFVYKWTRRFRKRRPQLGIYSAFYNSSVYLEAHLNSIKSNTSGEFDYYIMKNFSKVEEANRFDEIVSRFPFVTVFPSLAGKIPCPMRHGDSLQRMFARTDNDIIVICDNDSLLSMKGWDRFIIEELETKDVVGVIANFENRTGQGRIPLVIHPSFMAFRRSFLEDNGLTLLEGEGNDPAYQVTKFLMQQGQFDERRVTPIVASQVDYPNGWFGKNGVFGKEGEPSHGFCARYRDIFFHFWHSMNYAEGKDIVAEDGSVLVPHEVVVEKVDRYCAPYLGD